MLTANFTKDHDSTNLENCKDKIPVMEFTGFGKAYVPRQELCEMFSAPEGFMRGTMFPELDIPYVPRAQAGRGGENIG